MVRGTGGDKPLVGVICLAAPVELVEAAGAIPVRLMTANADSELRGGRFLSSDACSFCKSLLGGLDRGDVRVDAVLGATTCDQMRRNLEIISRDLQLPVFIFNAPRTTDNPIARRYALDELKRVAADISAWTGKPIHDEELTARLHLRQEVRRHLRALRDPYAAGIPRLSGGEFLELMRLFQTLPLEAFERHLSVSEASAATDPTASGGAPVAPIRRPLRLALLGSCSGDGDDQIVRISEESGEAVIVYDAVCTGSRALKSDDPLPADPWEALLSLYHDQVLCPHKRPNDLLIETIARDIESAGVQGVIYKTLKFCHPWGFEARRFRDRLRLPFLHLDHDLSDSAGGQLRTRIHAFLEQLAVRRKPNPES